MADTHSSMSARPSALTIEALPYGGFAISDTFGRFQHGLPGGIVAAFTRLPDAIGWMEEQLSLPAGDGDVDPRQKR